MRSHPSDREAYAALKRSLAALYSEDIFSYVCGKDAFVATIDAKTGFKGTRITKALTPREWEKARVLRQEYFLKASIKDFGILAFEHPPHLHYLLYQQSEIVGYLHLQLLSEWQSILWMMVIDQGHQDQGLGKKFLSDIERWLREQGIKQLHVQSFSADYSFYLKQGYREMPLNDVMLRETNAQNINLGKAL